MAILCTTLRKLQAKGASVYVVTVPMFTMPRGAMSNKARDGFDNPAQDMAFPAQRQVFADRAAAAKFMAQHEPLAQRYGAPAATLAVVPATSLDVFTGLPVAGV